MQTHRLISRLSGISQNSLREVSDLAQKREQIQNLILKKEAESSSSTSISPFYDTFGRMHNYLRISLTERCNLRCTYCMPEEGVPLTPKDHLLSTEEIIQLVRIFASNGIDKIRVTGGEPTIRKDLKEIIYRIKSVPTIKSLGMTTNGITLYRNVKDLASAGLDKINISLDTLKEDKFLRMTRRKGLHLVLKSVAAAEDVYPMVKINNVVMRHENYVEMLSFIEWTKNRRLDVRFIEYMPFGGNAFDTDKFVGYKEMMERVRSYFGDDVIKLKDDPHDTTKAYKIKGYQGQFGFISSMSENFCGTCNRLRITADGNLKVCLHGNKEVSMRDLLRSGASEDEITDVVRETVFKKKKQHAGMENLKNLPNRPMILIGGPTLRLFCTNSDNKLSHINSDGSVKQVDVSDKPSSHREAVAQGFIRLTPRIVQQVKYNHAKKGDVLNIARLASIMGAKQTSTLIPLCHNVPINVVSTEFELNEETCELKITSTAKTYAPTGIEMEALTAVSIAALTVYDMCKAVSSEMVIHDIRLVSKTGGRKDYFL